MERPIERKESTITINWTAVLSVFAVILGFFFLSLINHESRLTKNETMIPVVIEAQAKSLAKQESIERKIDIIRQDQVDRKRNGAPEYKGIKRSE